jgi:hypothetical protein
MAEYFGFQQEGLMFNRLPDGTQLLAIAIIFATLIGAWMFRYEDLGPGVHRNRFTGVVCSTLQECWFAGI